MVGCLIYELCFLKRPFDGESISMIMINIINSEPDFTSEIHKFNYSENLIQLIADCLRKNPYERPEMYKIFDLAKNILKNNNSINQKFYENNNQYQNNFICENHNFNFENFNCSFFKENKINNLIKLNNEFQKEKIFKSDNCYKEKKQDSILDPNFNITTKSEKIKIQIEVDEEEIQENNTDYDFIIKKDHNQDTKTNIFYNYCNNKNKYDKLVEKNEKENNKELKIIDIKKIKFFSKTFLENTNSNKFSDETNYEKSINFKNNYFKYSTPSHNKEDIKKILKNMKISSINNDYVDIIKKINNNNFILKSTKEDQLNSDIIVSNSNINDYKYNNDLFRKWSINSDNNMYRRNILHSDLSCNVQVNNIKENHLSSNFNKNLNNNSGKIFVNNTTKNNSNKINFNFTNIIKIKENSNINTSNKTLTTSDITTKLQNFKNSDYKNNSKIFNNMNIVNKSNDNFNKLNSIKKGHFKTISINISSIQSPEHNAVYEIENIEQCQNIEIIKKIEMHSKNKFTLTPTNFPSVINKIKDKISPNKIRDTPNSTVVGILHNNCINNNKNFLGNINEDEDKRIINKNKKDQNFINNFLIKKY